MQAACLYNFTFKSSSRVKHFCHRCHKARAGKNTERVPLSYACYSSFRFLPRQKIKSAELSAKKKNATETKRFRSVLYILSQF